MTPFKGDIPADFLQSKSLQVDVLVNVMHWCGKCHIRVFTQNACACVLQTFLGQQALISYCLVYGI